MKKYVLIFLMPLLLIGCAHEPARTLTKEEVFLRELTKIMQTVQREKQADLNRQEQSRWHHHNTQQHIHQANEQQRVFQQQVDQMNQIHMQQHMNAVNHQHMMNHTPGF